jgi:hypothetical protein
MYHLSADRRGGGHFFSFRDFPVRHANFVQIENQFSGTSLDTPELQELYQFRNKLKLLIVARLLNGTGDIVQKDWN